MRDLTIHHHQNRPSLPDKLRCYELKLHLHHHGQQVRFQFQLMMNSHRNYRQDPIQRVHPHHQLQQLPKQWMLLQLTGL
jgi:hypothetical protein